MITVVVPLNRVSLGAKYISRADQLQAEPANVGQSQVLDLNMDINVKVTGKSHDPKVTRFVDTFWATLGHNQSALATAMQVNSYA